jgi:hypothetical protein
MRKTDFFWASIHGADPEPVERTILDGRAGVLTIGCADPFWLDEDPCPVLFINRHAATGRPEPMWRPQHPDKIIAERAALEEARKRNLRTYTFEGRRIPVPHGWRGPR